MAEEQEAIPGPDIGDPKSRRRRALDHVNRIRSQHRWIDHLAAAVELYHHDRIEYYALKVVSRGLFLAVSVMLVFLYVFDLTTNLIPGINEIAIPTMSLPDEQDLGQVVHLTLQHSRGALMDVVGFGTLLVSAVLTAKALRRGTAQVLQSEDADRVHTFQLRNLVIGLGLALVVLASWLLVFVTAIRSAAIRTVLGPGITSAQVNVGKAAVIALTWVL
ncbi:MAG: hypothetical protein WCP28_09420, partial [Actinomycetes bacterium]